MNDELPYELNPIETTFGNVFLNPGTGAVRDASEQHAIDNMRQFIQDARCDGLYFRRAADKDYGEGRYAFLVLRNDYDRVIEIQMPGIPVDKVRFTGAPDQNIWNYPRLYKDGSSWVWQYAVIDEEDYAEDDD